MDYNATLDWMFQQLPMYQNKGRLALKKDLTNTLKFSKYLNNPHQKFKTVHVAGTNGKGSTSHMLASILQESGYNVGLYTSPHLKDFRERIRLNGKKIPKKFVTNFINENKSFLDANTLSFFEMTVVMAFDYFAKQNVDIAIIEVGLGGRLDSTNIINPEVSVITNIGYDHMDLLGDTLEKIATEKAGIIKPNTPVVIGETHLETAPVFKTTAELNNGEIYFADQDVSYVLESDLKGNYQAHNIKTVIQTIMVLEKLNYKVSEKTLKKGLLKVVENTGIQGRWQMLSNSPKIICDTAHNKEGLAFVINQLKLQDYKKLHIVFGVVSDKDLSTILPLLPVNAAYYLCKPNVQRGLEAQKLQHEFLKYNLFSNCYDSVALALNSAKSKANENDLIFVGGSTFVVGEIT